MINQEKNKVFLKIEDGIVSSVKSTDDVEVIILDYDKHKPSISHLNVIEPEKQSKTDLIQNVYDEWKQHLEKELDYSHAVDVIPDGQMVTHEFSGFANEGIKKDTDGSYYISVEDQEGNRFDVDILYVLPAD